MKGQIRRSWMVTAALLASAAFGYGQAGSMSAPTNPIGANRPAARPANNQQAGPGTVNYVEGQASIDGQQISPTTTATGTAVQAGQVLDTGTNGYVEVLLTPGAFLRLGNNSEARVMQVGLVNTTIQLARGSAMVEADQVIKGSHLAFMMNGATTQIEKKGLYDFDANQQAVRVLDGRAKVSEAAGVKTIGKNDQLLLASAKPLKSIDFNKKALEAEPLFVWSEARSADESQANYSTANYVMANGGWYGPGWYWDPYLSFYAFLPADGFLYSPFGWGLYSPGFLYAYGPYYGYPGFAYRGYAYRGFHGHVGGFAGRVGAYRGFHGHVGGFAGRVGAYRGGAAGGHGFAGGGFHGMAGGFHGMGGGFHGGGGGRR